MESRRYVSWGKTGKNLQLLRQDNIILRKKVCREIHFADANCSGVCEQCKYEMDSSISRPELAKVFMVSENVIFNWEKGKTPISIEDLLFYCQLAEVEIADVLVFE